MKNSGNENTLSSWLPKSEESSSGDPSLESKKNASTWLGVELTKLPLEEKPTKNISTSLPLEEGPQISISQPIPREEKPPIRYENRTPSNFNQTIIRVFSNEPHRAVPPIQNQRKGQSMLDFLGRGFAIQGPANHSQPLTSSHQQPSVNQRSFLDFMTNPFASPSSTIVAPNATRSNNTNRIIYC